MRTAFLLLLLSCIAAPSFAEDQGPAPILHMLDYMAVDYPATVENGTVEDQFEYAEQMEFAGRVAELIAKLPDNADKGQLLAAAQRLAEQIRTKAPGDRVAATARSIHSRLAAAYGVATAPRKTPDLEHGKALFTEHCVACHGPEGRGNGPKASELTPAPNNFHDKDRQYERSVFGLYSAVSLGVQGTAMRGFTELSDGERWSLAFYVSRFVFDRELREQGRDLWEAGEGRTIFPAMTALTRSTPNELLEHHGKRAVAILAYLRGHPRALAETTPLETALQRLTASYDRYRRGDVDGAYREALASYLDGFELGESALRATAPDLVSKVEAAMLEYRRLVRSGAPVTDVGKVYDRLTELLESARRTIEQTELTPSMGFVSALVILLREGLEAILVLAAIAGVLVKSDRRDALPYLHAGWAAALLLGVVTWWVSARIMVISGASREVTEGVTALVATVVLLYVGFWLHGKTHAHRWRTFVQEKIHKALHGRTLWVLSFVAFLAVYREVFETVLFYQALWLQAGDAAKPALWSGITVGAALLVLLTWVILRSSLRLPLRLFFNVNAGILLVLAVVFAGHGIAALQEAGILNAEPIPFPSLGLLGIYPTLETLGTQFAVIAVVAGFFLYERAVARRYDAGTEGR